MTRSGRPAPLVIMPGSLIASIALLAATAAAEPPLPAAPERGVVDGVFATS